jgi:hypothetical protein
MKFVFVHLGVLCASLALVGCARPDNPVEGFEEPTRSNSDVSPDDVETAITKIGDRQPGGPTLRDHFSALTPGTTAQKVHDQVGQPNQWGHVEIEPYSGPNTYSLNTSWMTTGGYGPLPITGEDMKAKGYAIVSPQEMGHQNICWVYRLGENTESLLGFDDQIAFVQFKAYKLELVFFGYLIEIYDP